KPRRAFLSAALADLNEQASGALTALQGDPASVIPAAARQAGASSVHVTAEFTPYGRARDRRVADALAAQGVGWVATGSPYAVPPGQIRKSDGSRYRVFTPYSKAWAERGWPGPVPQPHDVDWLGYDGPHRTNLPAEPVAAGSICPEPRR